MKRTDDDFRAMVDVVEMKLKDVDSLFATAKFSLSNSAAYQWKKLFTKDESRNELYEFINDSISSRRKKLDNELVLMLQQRYYLAPGNLRERFDHCWADCLSNSFARNIEQRDWRAINHRTMLIGGVVSIFHDPQLVTIASQAWQAYLEAIPSIIKKAWKDASDE